MHRTLALALLLFFAARPADAADNFGQPYANDSPKFRADLNKADRIVLRTEGVPPMPGTTPRQILEIQGRDEVRRFLAPFDLFGPKTIAARCDCTGGPTIEIYRGKRLITSIAIQHSVALSWPERWPENMNLASADILDGFNQRMADLGFPQYQQEHQEMLALVKRLQATRTAAAANDTPLRRLLGGVPFTAPEWRPALEEPTKITFQDGSLDTMVLIVAPRNRAMPDPRDLTASRENLRRAFASTPVRLVEAKPIEVSGVVGQWLVMKERQEGTGFFYQTTVILPSGDYDIVVNIACHERGTTGLRESAVVIARTASGEVSSEDPMAGFYRDPYDSRFDAGALYALSDDPKWDANFPDHPLSRTRRKIQAILDSLTLPESVVRAAIFRPQAN